MIILKSISSELFELIKTIYSECLRDIGICVSVSSRYTFYRLSDFTGCSDYNELSQSAIDLLIETDSSSMELYKISGRYKFIENCSGGHRIFFWPEDWVTVIILEEDLEKTLLSTFSDLEVEDNLEKVTLILDSYVRALNRYKYDKRNFD